MTPAALARPDYVCGCGTADRTVARTSLPGGVYGGPMCSRCYRAHPAVRAQRVRDLINLADELYAGRADHATVFELLGRWRIPRIDRLRLWLEVEAACAFARECTNGNVSPAHYNMPSRAALDRLAEDAIGAACADLLDGAQ